MFDPIDWIRQSDNPHSRLSIFHNRFRFFSNTEVNEIEMHLPSERWLTTHNEHTPLPFPLHIRSSISLSLYRTIRFIFDFLNVHHRCLYGHPLIIKFPSPWCSSPPFSSRFISNNHVLFRHSILSFFCFISSHFSHFLWLSWMGITSTTNCDEWNNKWFWSAIYYYQDSSSDNTKEATSAGPAIVAVNSSIVSSHWFFFLCHFLNNIIAPCWKANIVFCIVSSSLNDTFSSSVKFRFKQKWFAISTDQQIFHNLSNKKFWKQSSPHWQSRNAAAGVEDMVLLRQLNDDAIVENLRKRLGARAIFVCNAKLISNN